MNILITGSRGFIGNYFINEYSSNYKINTFSFVKENLDNLNLEVTELVLHLSALVHQMGGASASEYERVNVTQTLELAKRAKESGVKHFIFMSSVKVYGEETDRVYTETTPCHPEDDYGKSKLRAEEELLKLQSEEFQVSIVRTPIVYGYGVKANIKSLVNLVKKISILPFGNINNKRSMVYIGNLAHLVNELIQEKKQGVFLAADDTSVSTSEFIKIIAENLNKRIYLIELPFFETLLKFFKPSFHKRLYGSLEVNNDFTKKELNLQNPFSTKEGIRKMLYGDDR
ncbi:MAG: NAD-dependent epimerase/dehydratase family protein [Campylobacterales bacterium]|nr:NAD-dependent epimerase/dehydratase family protein [Campylobacterales bacterium]